MWVGFDSTQRRCELVAIYPDETSIHLIPSKYREAAKQIPPGLALRLTKPTRVPFDESDYPPFEVMADPPPFRIPMAGAVSDIKTIRFSTPGVYRIQTERRSGVGWPAMRVNSWTGTLVSNLVEIDVRPAGLPAPQDAR